MQQSQIGKPRTGKSNDYRYVVIFEKINFQNVLGSPHDNEKPAFSNSSGLIIVLENLFCDGLVYTVDLTVEIMLRFQICTA